MREVFGRGEDRCTAVACRHRDNMVRVKYRHCFTGSLDDRVMLISSHVDRDLLEVGAAVAPHHQRKREQPTDHKVECGEEQAGHHHAGDAEGAVHSDENHEQGGQEHGQAIDSLEYLETVGGGRGTKVGIISPCWLRF